MRVTNVDDARQLVERYIERLSPLPDNDEWTVAVQDTIEKPWGWVFFYTSRKFLETDEFRYAVAGNAPLIVEKDTGRLIVTGTAQPIEQYIQAYERSGDPHG